LLWWSRMKSKGKRASQKDAVVERMRFYARIRVLILPTFFLLVLMLAACSGI